MIVRLIFPMAMYQHSPQWLDLAEWCSAVAREEDLDEWIQWNWRKLA